VSSCRYSSAEARPATPAHCAYAPFLLRPRLHAYRPSRAMAAASPKPPAAAPAAVDLDDDIRNRTPSGWPMQAQPPPLEVMMAGRRYRLQQGRTNEGLHALLWPVSRLLVRYIEANAADFRGARVLELGAGVVRARGRCAGVQAAGGSARPGPQCRRGGCHALSA